MNTRAFSAVLFALSTAVALSQTPPSADELLAKARAKAAEAHKSIWVIFDASW
jgi:hypothetical protein